MRTVISNPAEFTPVFSIWNQIRESVLFLQWNNEGLEVAKTFHSKFTSVSPVWFTLPNGNVKKFQLPSHDVQRKWLKDMRAANSANHTVKSEDKYPHCYN